MLHIWRDVYSGALYTGDGGILTGFYGMTREMFFFKNHVKNEVGKLVPDFFLSFLKVV